MLSGENAGKGVIYTLNNTILKVNFDMSFLKGEVVTIDFTNKIKQNSDIKKYEEENWRVKDIKIIHKYNKKWCPYIYNNENGGIVTDKKECNETIPVNNTPASTYRFGYIKNNTSIKTNVCVDYIDVIDDIYNEYRACVVGLIAEVILERPKKLLLAHQIIIKVVIKMVIIIFAVYQNALLVVVFNLKQMTLICPLMI